ncbi:MAG TPA: hypothetical protein DCO83_13170 [Mucilaginibacter sp.]|jgi:hypothetical protein|nr:hypothetical protein [Mucilaginibacter sp.]
MKPTGLVAFFIPCFISCSLFVQSPKAIEADLYKSFKKMNIGVTVNLKDHTILTIPNLLEWQMTSSQINYSIMGVIKP